MIEIPASRRERYLRNCRVLAVVSATLAAVYLWWLLFKAQPENIWLYRLLVAAEVFNIVQAAGFWLTISFQKWSEPEPLESESTQETVDVFITVRGEPVDVVEQTLAAATGVRHPRKTVWILDDGDSPEVRALSARYSAGYLTREDHRGAKAGNVNHALGVTTGDYFVIFDADQAPHPDFLERTLGAFRDPAVAYVQTPQVYRNRFENRVAAGAHDQQALFYGPILRGKNGMGAVFCCGTNVVFSRRAMDDIGGMAEDSITEDLRVSLLLIRKGYSSVYVSTILAEGLGPLDVASYFKQQFRWGRGGLDILLRRHPYSGAMRPGQAVQYSLGFLYWFTGWAYLAYLLMPIFLLVGGARPIHVPNEYPSYFLPYVLSALATIIYATDFEVSFAALWFTLASFPVQVKALVMTLLSGRARFVITPKEGTRASLRPVWPQVLAMSALLASAVYGIARFGARPAVVNNVAWIVAHLVILQGFVWMTFFPARGQQGEAAEAEAYEPNREQSS